MLAVLLVFVLIAGLAVFRLVIIQMLKHKDYERIAELIHIKRLPIPARRGEILDCHQRVLAGCRDTLSYWACSFGLTGEEKEEARKQLAGFPGIERQKVDYVFGDEERYKILRRFCDEDTASRIGSLHVPGVGSTVEHLRYYTSDCASSVVGFVNTQGDALEGAERSFDGLLSGVPGTLIINPYVRLRGAPLPQKVLKAPTDGCNIILTIDNTIQHILYEHLREACQEWEAPLALGVIMDPKTGAILAMASFPSYSSSNYAENYIPPGHGRRIPGYLADLLKPGSRYKARCVTDLYEPGSLFKVFVMAAALDANVVQPLETFNCENGSMNMGKFRVPDWHRFGVLTVEDILVHSSDIGMAKIGMRLTARVLDEYLMRFGLLDKPGLGLFAEPEPRVKKPSEWSQQYTCFASFGQGVSFSAVSLVSAVSAIANDGILMQPYILAAVQDADGNIIRRTSPTVVRRVIQASTARTIAGMMRKVVTDGSGRQASIPGVAVCGKTGTAQPFDYAAKCYLHDELVTSFAGFAPAEDPKLALLITVFSPRNKQQEIWGSTVAAPIFSAVASHVLAYLDSRTPPFLQLAKNQRSQTGSRVGAGSS